MPILATVKDLKAGMRLGSNIVNKFSTLLPKGHVITKADINILTRLVPDKNLYIVDPTLDGIVEFEDVTHAQTVARVIQEKSFTVVDKVSSIVQSGNSLTNDNISDMSKIVKDSIDYLLENPVTMALIQESKDWENYLIDHSSSVFYLSLLIGNEICNYIKTERVRLSSAQYISKPTDLMPLATAAMFHDLGMVKLTYLYHKVEPLTNVEKEMMRLHPQNGAKLLPDSIGPVVRTSILYHHENQIGTGYPDGLAGDSIGVFSKIIRVADAYCAAIADRVDYKAKLPVVALYEMLHGDGKQYYDPEILSVFGQLVPPFPIGAKLKLQDGRYAVVVQHNRKSSFQPVVIIAFDQEGNKFSEDQIEPPFNLGEREDVCIDSFAGEDLSFLNERVYKLHAKQNHDRAMSFSFP